MIDTRGETRIRGKGVNISKIFLDNIELMSNISTKKKFYYVDFNKSD